MCCSALPTLYDLRLRNDSCDCVLTTHLQRFMHASSRMILQNDALLLCDSIAAGKVLSNRFLDICICDSTP